MVNADVRQVGALFRAQLRLLRRRRRTPALSRD